MPRSTIKHGQVDNLRGGVIRMCLAVKKISAGIMSHAKEGGGGQYAN